MRLFCDICSSTFVLLLTDIHEKSPQSRSRICIARAQQDSSSWTETVHPHMFSLRNANNQRVTCCSFTDAVSSSYLQNTFVCSKHVANQLTLASQILNEISKVLRKQDDTLLCTN